MLTTSIILLPPLNKDQKKTMQTKIMLSDMDNKCLPVLDQHYDTEHP